MATAEGANMNAADLAEQIARRCEKARPSGNGWQGCCPAHEDSSPSLTITPIDDKVLLHCFAGCEIDAILSALHMDKRDLFVSPIQRSNGHQRIATVYDYYDANGNLVHQTVRLDPKGFYQRRPDPAKPGEHIKNLKGIETVLYRLPELQDGIQSGHDVYICEGEKAVEAVCALGLTATCSPMGAGKWRDAYNPYLRGAHCIVLPDNDTPGQQHAQQVARSLYGLAASVRIVTLPGLPASGDAYDWKAAGGTREQLAALVQATAPWTPGQQQEASASSSTTQAERPCFKTVSTKALYAKTLPPQQFVIPKILPVGVTLFAGRGKDGKSLMVWNLCIAVATGGVALGQYPVEQGDVLYMALEDGERRAQQRLKDQMAYMGNASPPERLTLVLWDAPRIGEGFEERLTTWLDEHPQAQLVVIDILEKIRPKRTRNGSIYADDYNALASLQRLAQERNIAILVVHHSNKSKPEDFRDTASGSMGLIGACDTFWSLQRIAGAADAVLHIIGRDVEAQDLALRFADGFWTALGNAEEYQLTQASQDILNILRHADGPRTPKQLAHLLNAPDATIRSRCVRMAARGEILNVGEGRYIPRIPGSTTPPPPPVEVDRSRGGESECTKCATPATPATVQLVQLMQLSPESRGRVAGTPEECNSDATLVTDGKDSALSDLSCRVAGVASSGQNGQGAQAMDVGQEDQGTQVLPVAQRVSQVNAGDTPDVSVPTPPFDAVIDDDADLPPEHRSDPLPTASHGTHATAPSCAHRWLQPGVYSRTCRDCGQREPLLAPPRRVSWAS